MSLRATPLPLACPVCCARPFAQFARHLVARRPRQWWIFGERWPRFAVICRVCKVIVAWER